MRTSITYLLAGTLLLSACQGQVPTRSAGTSPARKAPAPSKAVSDALPSHGVEAPPSPDVPMELIRGTVKIDANYVISAGGGNVISAGGGNVISAGGGNVISAGGGNVISAGGGNVISAGGGNYRLLDLAVPALPLGTILPVKGMMLAGVSLTTGKPIGQPVFSDETGAYALSVPQGSKDNILVVAGIPGKGADDPLVQDPRLNYAVFAAPKATNVAIDEETALVARYVRQALKARLAFLITPANLAAISSGDSTKTDTFLQGTAFSDTLRAVIVSLGTKLQQEIVDAKVPDDRLNELSQRTTDSMLAGVDFSQIPIDTANTIWKDPPAGLMAIQALVDIMHTVRDKAAAKMAQDPNYFASRPYMLAASRHYDIKKPSDVADFIVQEYLGQDGKQFLKIQGVLNDLGMSDDDRHHLDGAGNSIAVYLIFSIMKPDAQARIADAIKNFQ